MSELKIKLDSATKLAARGRISRRDFVQLAIAAGLTVPAATALFTKAVRAEPKKGGKLRLGLGHGATTDSLDPATYPDQITGTVGWGSAGNSLTEVDAKGNVIPDLAESFEPSDGATKWVFKLQQGRDLPQRQDGHGRRRRRILPPSHGRTSKSAAKSILAAVSELKADGEDTVVFTLIGRQCRLPLYRQRLSHADHAGQGRRRRRLGVGHPHRPLHPRQVGAGRARHHEAQSELLSRRAGSTRSRSSPSPTWRRAPTR